jgi:hypothetical protein
MTFRHRLATARLRCGLTVIGVAASVTMSAVGLLAAEPSDANPPLTQASPPRMTMGVTETKASPPSTPATPSAAPGVMAMPAPGTRPGM